MASLKEKLQSEEPLLEGSIIHRSDRIVDIKETLTPRVKHPTGSWKACTFILVTECFEELAYYGIQFNLVTFLKTVLQESNVSAARNYTNWQGTCYIAPLIGAIVADSYLGRYLTTVTFFAVYLAGMAAMSISASFPACAGLDCLQDGSSSSQSAVFFLGLYMMAIGAGGIKPCVSSFGADQFDEEDPAEAHSKVSFFSYFYLALNLGSLFSNTFLSYIEDKGNWALGFWASTAAAATALLLFLSGTPQYRHSQPCDNPIGSICRVASAACRNWKAGVSPDVEILYEGDEKADSGGRKLMHTEGFRFLDRAALIGTNSNSKLGACTQPRDKRKLCTVTQVEQVKSILRLLPIWLCTILYSVVFTQMASLFVVQGAAMRRNTMFAGFSVPPSSMSAFDILTVATTIFLYRRAICPFMSRLTGRRTGPTELQRMGLGLVLGAMAMATAGTVEHFRKASATTANSSDLHIIWQVPQYALIGVSEVMMYVGQLEFFNGEMPDGFKSFGSALCMMSMSLGNYFSDVIVSAVTRATAVHGRPGWIPADLNEGHLNKFYFLLAILAVADFAVYLVFASRYRRSGKMDGRCDEEEEVIAGQVASPVYA